MPLFRDADAVVHLTWIVQPNHRQADLRAVNVGGSRRVHEAVAAAGVPILVHASAFGAYAGGAGGATPPLTPLAAARPSFRP